MEKSESIENNRKKPNIVGWQIRSNQPRRWRTWHLWAILLGASYPTRGKAKEVWKAKNPRQHLKHLTKESSAFVTVSSNNSRSRPVSKRIRCRLNKKQISQKKRSSSGNDKILWVSISRYEHDEDDRKTSVVFGEENTRE